MSNIKITINLAIDMAKNQASKVIKTEAKKPTKSKISDLKKEEAGFLNLDKLVAKATPKSFANNIPIEEARRIAWKKRMVQYYSNPTIEAAKRLRYG
jgi:hypothetical protein